MKYFIWITALLSLFFTFALPANAGCGQRQCTTTPVYQTGTEGPDMMLGYGGDDWFDGRGGNDEITSASGSDTIFGGNGDDIIYAGDGSDYVDAGEGADYVSTSDILAKVFLRGGDDRADVSGKVFGGDGNDTIRGAGIFYGNAGNDFVEGSNTYDDMLLGNEGSDTLNGGGGDDVLIGSSTGPLMYSLLTDEVNRLVGGPGSDRLIGGRGINIMMADNGDPAALLAPQLSDGSWSLGNGFAYPSGASDSEPDIYFADGNDVVVDGDSLLAIVGSDGRLYVYGQNQTPPTIPVGNTDFFITIPPPAVVPAPPGRDLVVRLENIVSVYGADRVAEGVRRTEERFREINTPSILDWIAVIIDVLEALPVES